MMINGHSLTKKLFHTLACCHHHAYHFMAKDYWWLRQTQVNLLDVSGAESASLNLNEQFTGADFRYRHSFNLYLGPSTPYTTVHFRRDRCCFH
jgi:hypothetical protein